ncbi:MAG TPA: di-heme oxidoredictase family protein [Polyangia bacterium]|nr:di-heme oxidoredictase family protein [Polyangia bacterium]
MRTTHRFAGSTLLLVFAAAGCVAGPSRPSFISGSSTTTNDMPTPVGNGDPPVSTGPIFTDPAGVGGTGPVGSSCGAGGGGGSNFPRGGFTPNIPSTVTTAKKAPLPISGGTLLSLADGKTVVASDPDRDQLYVVDTSSSAVRTIALQAGDEPGRLAQDAAGRVHVALRHGGALVTIDPSTATVTNRRDVCAAPRGVTYQAMGDLVHVACASGELVSFPAAGGAATRSKLLGRDLRDVVVDTKGTLFVSTFRKAQVLQLATDGTVAQTLTPPSGPSPSIMGPPQTTSPSVAWRMLSSTDSGGGVLMLHQTGVDDTVDPSAGGYAGVKGCPGIVGSLVTPLGSSTSPSSATARSGFGEVSLAVDAAITADGTQMALAVPGNSLTQGMPTVVVGSTSQMTEMTGLCSTPGGSPFTTPPTGEVVAVSFLGTTNIVVAQTREPAALWLSSKTGSIPLASDSLADTGHQLFHVNAGGGLACASCHPEGGEDGRVWNFACVGARRTQSIRGGISPTAPFHWDGSETDFSRLMEDVFVGRMAGPELSSDQKTALQGWIDTIPALPANRGLDAAAVARGKSLFNDTKVACASCHAGALLTNNTTVDVGTGGALQVPSLRGVSWRGPFMHTGCAGTLADRFDASCGGGDRHGVTSTLSTDQVGDLVTYLNSL